MDLMVCIAFLLYFVESTIMQVRAPQILGLSLRLYRLLYLFLYCVHSKNVIIS